MILASKLSRTFLFLAFLTIVIFYLLFCLAQMHCCLLFEPNSLIGLNLFHVYLMGSIADVQYSTQQKHSLSTTTSLSVSVSLKVLNFPSLKPFSEICPSLAAVAFIKLREVIVTDHCPGFQCFDLRDSHTSQFLFIVTNCSIISSDYPWFIKVGCHVSNALPSHLSFRFFLEYTPIMIHLLSESDDLILLSHRKFIFLLIYMTQQTARIVL